MYRSHYTLFTVPKKTLIPVTSSSKFFGLTFERKLSFNSCHKFSFHSIAKASRTCKSYICGIYPGRMASIYVTQVMHTVMHSRHFLS